MKRDLCIVGLGYVGLPLAISFDTVGHRVSGYDIDSELVSKLQSGEDPTDDLGSSSIRNSDIHFVDDPTVIEQADFVIVTVPTPVDDLKNPDLKYVEAAGREIGKHIQKETTVILESTVYPGATKNVFAPAIEETSELVAGTDFFLAYSPERVVPGDNNHGIQDVVKVVSAQNKEILDQVAALYETIVDAGVHQAPKIEVAEAAKCVENIQRDINIALVNELAVACNNLDIDTHDVLNAAKTKWNFHDYQPGLVGGHCIPVDPFFMIFESERNGFSPRLIETARDVNEFMPKHVADLTIRGLNSCGKVLQESRVLILGLSYKPNVSDVRTSAIGGTIKKLDSFDISISGFDPYCDNDILRNEFDIDVQEKLSFSGYDGVILATPHDRLIELDYLKIASQMKCEPLLVDVMGALQPDIVEESEMTYMRV